MRRYGDAPPHIRPRKEKLAACSVEGCEDNGPFVRGWCLPHYRRFYNHGDPIYKRPAVPTRSRRVPEGIESTRDLAKVLGVSRQRAHQLLNQDKHNARGLVAAAIRSGVIAKPPFCFRCGNKTEDLEAHHWDYDRPLDVGWFCPKCHAAVHPHAPNREQQRAPIPAALMGQAGLATRQTNRETPGADSTGRLIARSQWRAS